MAIAGKVAITLSIENGGAWSADVTYDRLVAVKHNNNLYISRKTVANVEPPNNEFWFLALEGFSGDDVQALIDRMNELSDLIQAIINGTTQVGNAKTLDGHEAEYFAAAVELSNYVPLDGSKPMTGEFLKIMSGYGALSASQGHVALVSYPNPNDTNVSDVLVMFNSLWGNRGIFYRQQVNDVLTDYPILHTGNKPTGTYTGNGDATERIISTGNAIGNTCMITSDKGFFLLSTVGGMGKKTHDTAVVGIGASNASCLANQIIIVTDNELLNASGVTYTYWYL